MSLLLNNSADLEKKLRELAVCGIYHGFSPECSHCAARLILAREAAALGRAEGRLYQFLVMKNERPIDSCYWDRHEERSIREKVKNV